MNQRVLVRTILVIGICFAAAVLSSGKRVQALDSCGTNRSDVYTDLQGNRCFTLDCSLHYNQSRCTPLVTTGCRSIPASCGSGSYYSGDLNCASDGNSVSWSYYCGATGAVKLKTVMADFDCTATLAVLCPPQSCSDGCYWDASICDCECSPILVDVAGNGFRLTNVNDGIHSRIPDHRAVATRS